MSNIADSEYQDVPGTDAPGPVATRYRQKSSGASFMYMAMYMAIALLVMRTAAGGDGPPTILAITLLPIAAALFRRREWPLFTFAFGVNLLAVIIVADFYVVNTGSVLGIGNDTLLFSQASVDVARMIAHGQWDAITGYSYYSGYGYIVVGGALNALLAPVGPFSPLTVRIANAFVGASIGPAVYRIAESEYAGGHPALPMSAAILAGSFPTLVAYSASGLRDVWVVSATIWVVALSVSLHRNGWLRRLRRYVSIATLIILIYYFRPESLAPVLAFLTVWFLSATRRHFATAIMAASLLLVIFTSEKWLPLLDRYDLERTGYKELALEQADAGSIGAALLRLPSPINGVARVAYAAFAPIPPSFKGGPDRSLIGVGAVMWYYILPLAVIGIAIAIREGGSAAAVGLATAVSGLSLLVGVGLTSVDVRHKTVLMPFGILFATYAFYKYPRTRLERMVLALSLMYGLLFAAYLVIKYA